MTGGDRSPTTCRRSFSETSRYPRVVSFPGIENELRSASRGMATGEEGKYALETARADRSVWLMKCPPVVTRSWQSAAASTSSTSASDPHPVVAKVVLSLDPLHPDESSSLQFKMEMAQTDSDTAPKSYSLNMFKDFVPMCVFSESNQGKAG